ncbi:MAG: TRAP transporter large permease subunit, partial [Dehalococcoidales bacterium]|nr:TRAP transporter large permease subunit [Dehalococcoidales bacterium]
FAFEITEVMLIFAVFFTIAHTHNLKGHITVDVISAKLSKNGRLILSFITDLLALGMFAIIIWQAFVLTQSFYSRGNFHSDSFHVIAWPFAGVIIFGTVLMELLIFRDFLKDISKSTKAGLKWHQWLLMLGISIIMIALSVFLVQKGSLQMNLATIGFIGLAFFMILLLAGVPVAFTLLISGFIFISQIRGWDPALNTLSRGFYSNTGNFVWATVPFFVLMGYFCLHSKIGEDLYALFYRWLGHIRGGLAIATTTACCGFAAIVGDSISSIATMTSVAMPQMKKYKYDDRLSTGAVAGGSIIGPVIPPSIPFIIYGVITGVSIGQLFIAGIVPGLLLGLAFAVTIYIWCRINPNVGPAGEHTPWGLRFRSLTASVPILLLFLLVIGGIYGGVFSPSEGGAMGAMGALFIGLAMRRFTWHKIWLSLIDTAKVLGMLLLIVNGAVLFTRFVAWCNVSDSVSAALAGAGLTGLSMVLLILILFLILGFFVDILTLTLIGVPIVHPIIVAQGMDPVWFAILILLILILGSLTPPVGINLFTMKGMAPHIPMGSIYRGAIPFVISSVIVIIMIFSFPAFVTWLPNVLK